MRIARIRQMIAGALADEIQTSRLATMVRQLARQRGLKPTPQDIANTVSFVREYVQHVPIIMEQALEIGRRLDLRREVEQVTGELENYWFTADDLIPDHLGLIGLSDDAYATFVLLQAMSDYCSANFGRPLLEQNFTQANLAMRGFIGEPAVSTLEARVGVTLANAMMGRVLGQIASRGFTVPAGPDPMWGNASIDDIVKARLGAMGVV